jgi:hypothetical protein
LVHSIAIGLENRIGGVDVRLERKHRLSGLSSVAKVSAQCHQPQQSVLNPQAGQRQTACIRYISATPHRSQIILSTGGDVTLSGVGWAGFGVWESPMRGLSHAQ